MVVGSTSTPPLQIVLGSLASDDTTSSSCAAEASARGSNSTAYVLGTSAYPHLGSGLKLKIDGRVPMEDRKAPLSQFRPRSLMLSVSYHVHYCSSFAVSNLTTFQQFIIISHSDVPSCSNQCLVNSFNLLLRSVAIRTKQ